MLSSEGALVDVPRQTASSEHALVDLAGRVIGAASAAVGAVSGLAPHVLHHVGPIAGAALLTGAEGSALFGLLGFGFTIPLLLRLKRRFGTWLAPAIALAFFLATFSISTLWVGPIIRGEVQPADSTGPVDEHHPLSQGAAQRP